MLWKEAFSSQTAFHATALAYTRRCFLFPFGNRRAPDRSERGALERGPLSPYALAVNNSPPVFIFYSPRWSLSGRTSEFWGGIWVISEKNYTANWFREIKISYKETPALKKSFNVAYSAEKNLNSISRDLGKKNSYSNQNTHTSPLQKSNGWALKRK